MAALVALASLAIAVNVGASPSAAGPALAVTMSGARAANTISYSVVIANNGASVIGNIFVAADVPSGTSFSKVTATPSGFGFQGVQGSKVVFLGTSVAANSTATISYDVNVSGATVGDAVAWVHALSPSDMTASGSATIAAVTAASSPRRGCLACHVLVDPASGAYTLPFEAEERAKARGLDHPQMAPDGTSIKVTDAVGPEVCLQCHAPGKGDRAGMGNIAPLSLRDIVHPAHMFSVTFKEHYGGQCF
ncbi:MAG: hypothetical protein Q8R28_10035 [Dehalococcoidia bacterium]|nr:hypothetical protein [Dehalococcoidia bacterium]